MKIFLLVITILFLFHRIKSTPRMLSKKLYLENASKLTNKAKEIKSVRTEDEMKIIQGLTLIIDLLFVIFCIIYYFIIGCKFDTTMALLSAIQIITMLINLRDLRLVVDIDKYEFRRWYFLFNVILDYIYYPMTIYLLLNN